MFCVQSPLGLQLSNESTLTYTTICRDSMAETFCTRLDSSPVAGGHHELRVVALLAGENSELRRVRPLPVPHQHEVLPGLHIEIVQLQRDDLALHQ